MFYIHTYLGGKIIWLTNVFSDGLRPPTRYLFLNHWDIPSSQMILFHGPVQQISVLAKNTYAGKKGLIGKHNFESITKPACVYLEPDGHLFINVCFNWMILFFYARNGCFTQHP